MLEPQTRATLTDELAPPLGYRLSHAVGTTFTLDLASALAVPLSFASRRVTAADDQLGVLDAVRRSAGDVDIFAQAGELSLGARTDLVALLEPMIHPVSQHVGIFHPKVWFLEYERDGDLRYRFICASRNLTGDRSWDVIVTLDGERETVPQAPEVRAINEPIVAMLRRLPALAVQPLSDERRTRIDGLADRLEDVHWETPEHTDDVRFHVFGPGATPDPDLSGRMALVISPFVTDGALRRIRAGITGVTHLLSRAVTLDRLVPSSLDAKLRTSVLDDAAVFPDEEPQRGRLSGLHAKALLIDRGKRVHMLFGSANATDAGWGANSEVMVEVSGSRHHLRIDRILEGLGELRQDYATDGGASESEEEAAERVLESVARELAAVPITVRAVDGDPHAVRVWADANSESLLTRLDGEHMRVRWSLLTRPDLSVDGLPVGEVAAAEVGTLELTDITPFITLALVDTSGRERRTIVLAQLLDDPPDRHDAVITRQLTSREAFVRLLTLMLDLGGFALPMRVEGDGLHGGSDWGNGIGASGLFEALVRALGAGHGGLRDAQRIVGMLRKQGADDILPPGFDELWEQIWAAHEVEGGAP